MRIAVCDDSTLSQILFIDVLREWNPAEHPECFSTGADLLKAAEAQPHFDIVFLDIYFPNENGIEIGKRIREISPETGIVFITNSTEHAVDAYSLNALHYLLKPITEKGVRESFRRLDNFRSQKRSMLSVVVDHAHLTLYQDNISYIFSVKHAKDIHMTDGQILRVWMGVQELEENLDGNFKKLNKGTIVNMEQIMEMRSDFCILRDGTKLLFSRRERKSIQTAYDKFLFSRVSEKNRADAS